MLCASLAKPYFSGRKYKQKMDSKESFNQSNAYAMKHGIVLGAWGIASLSAMLAAMSRPPYAFLADTLMVLSPFVAAALTIRFRQKTTAPGEAFTFGRGYVHTLLEGLYACVWIALAVYAYFSYMDGGTFFNNLEAMFARPETQEMLAALDGMGYFDELYASTGADNLQQVVLALRELSPANYAGMIVSTTLFTAPIISLFVALLTRRRRVTSDE